VGLNFDGNHGIHPDPSISLAGRWIENDPGFHVTENRATESSRGASSRRWPVELILSRGYGLATVYAADFDPDFDDGFANGVHQLVGGTTGERDSSSWGTLAAWAWGLSRCMDYFEKDPDIDAGRVAVIGHSRMGKAALWAGAMDERFAMVVSNNSGCGGAALSRRDVGETVSAINERFPHWFAQRFKSYSDRENDLPVDQHMLAALIAPRPLYVASAAEDEWADPHGEYLSLFYGSRVYALYGQEAIERVELPAVGTSLQAGRLGYHIRPGEHDLTRYDWERYLDFADLHLQTPAGPTSRDPVRMEWVVEHIAKKSPRLVLTPEMESVVKQKLEAGDPLTLSGFRLLQQSADELLDSEPLVFQKTGRRLLGVSREAIRRLTSLALVYRIGRDQRHLQRLEEELTAVCRFEHWNPSHFLDVAEMAAGVALALDWAGEWISPEVGHLAREALVEKALKPGIAVSSNNNWVEARHNWNLVCHGGLSLAALAVFEQEPELASLVLDRAISKIPLALAPYAPGGVYPEGPSYWSYATTYLTLAVSAFESALGTDFGFHGARGVKESAFFSQVLAGPSGEYFNYFDASLEGFQDLEHFGLLAWFSHHYGTNVDLDACRRLMDRESSNSVQVRDSRYFSIHFLFLALVDPGKNAPFVNPGAWIADGEEPIAIFRDPGRDPDGFFLAAKGGRAADNHGNMDAGSFVFELDGVRWSVDPGNQDYHTLEQKMGTDLWNSAQDSPRWELLTKNNSGHSTLTVNGQRHLAEMRATLSAFDLRTGQPQVTFDMTGVFGGGVQGAQRSFTRVAADRLRVRDEIRFAPETNQVTWQMVTTAEARITGNRVELSHEGRKLVLEPAAGVPFTLGVVSLSPPPLDRDKDIPGLKRIEIRWERRDFQGEEGTLVVDLYRK
jgi:hypothetical protein